MTAASCKQLDTPIVYHLQSCRTRPQLTRVASTWGEFSAMLVAGHSERDDKDGPGFVLAEMSKPYRAAANVSRFDAVVLDMDSHGDTQPPPPDIAAEMLATAGLAGVVYTTHSHTDAAPRYRVVVPLAEPVLPADLQRVTSAAADAIGLTGEALDPKSWVVGQFFYLPSCLPDAPRFAACLDGAAFEPSAVEPEPLALPVADVAPPAQAARPATTYHQSGTSLYDAAKARARGQWRGILSSLGISVPDRERAHAPCPGCGGKDRFRFDDKGGDGSFICSQGGAGTLAGDGFDLVQHARRVDAAEALRLVCDLLGIQRRAAQPPAPAARRAEPDQQVDEETGEIMGEVQPAAAANDNTDLRLEELIREIEQGRSMSGYEAFAQSIAMDRTLSTMQRERLASALQGAIRTFHQTKLPIADVRRMVGIVKSRAGASALVDLQEQRHAPAWARRWVFRTDCDKFFNLVDKSSLSMTAFDFQHARMVPADVRDLLGFEKPSELCREVWDTPVIGGVCYLPTAGDLFELDGVPTANTYRPDIVPDGIPPDEWSSDERETVRLMEEHLANIVPIDEERQHLLQWMAWAVQRPGDKINWAPLIIGTYGDGKSLLANMLCAVMGGQNVRILAGGSIVESSFTGWGEGSSVTVIEEVRISGQNRFEVMDRLKPFITNDRVEVHAKHKDPKSVPNTASYLIFSNWVDAVPVDDKDRRYFILMTPFVGQTGQQLEEAGLTQAYFDRLFHGVHEHYRALRGWLQSVDVSDFPAKGRAPDSAAKAQVVEYCRTDDEIAIADAIESGGLGVTSDLFSSTCLSKAVADAGHQPPKTVAMNRVLQGMGYVQLPERIKWNGEKHRVWYSSALSAGMDAGRARRLLDDTRFA